MLPTRRREINAIAERIRDFLQLGTYSSPVDLDSCVHRLGGEIIRSANLTEAMIAKRGDSFRITINRNLHPNRERFSIAHEIGHLFLHMGYCIDDAKWNAIDEFRDDPMFRCGYSEEEREANEFAGAFLMPRDAFLVEFGKNETDDNKVDLKPIAEHFEVSVEAALRRGQWLGVVAWWEQAIR